MNAGQEMLKQLSFSNPFSKLLFTEPTFISRPGFFLRLSHSWTARASGQQQQILPRMRDLAHYGLSRYGNTADDWMVRDVTLPRKSGRSSAFAEHFDDLRV
ncbi:hypothetical protein I7I48_07360 [Histoplasma ohiense]|nr:hypothetical protein I7I48_07360 [Histoplasma ohiense (nom. inval.)]